MRHDATPAYDLSIHCHFQLLIGRPVSANSVCDGLFLFKAMRTVGRFSDRTGTGDRWQVLGVVVTLIRVVFAFAASLLLLNTQPCTNDGKR
jgi:hypothetical protein